jgi:hypothetical protein
VFDELSIRQAVRVRAQWVLSFTYVWERGIKREMKKKKEKDREKKIYVYIKAICRSDCGSASAKTTR